MAKLFDKVFGKKQEVAQKTQKPAFAPVERPKYDFVEQYTIVDPKRVLTDYKLFSGCKNIPVVCEESTKTPCGFASAIELPTKIIVGFLEALEKAPAEKIADPKMRTISIIHLDKDQRVVVGPCLGAPKTPILWPVDSKENNWVLHVTPEKNRAIVDALKIHTR